MSTLTTGLAGQQQARSARGGGPDQSALSSEALPAALALRRGNFIAAQPTQAAGCRRGHDRRLITEIERGDRVERADVIDGLLCRNCGPLPGSPTGCA